jgi:hypothetical protein
MEASSLLAMLEVAAIARAVPPDRLQIGA